MLRTFSWLRKIAVRILQHWILIPMSNLFLKAKVSFGVMILGLRRAFRRILVNFVAFHNSLFSPARQNND